jgi:hypothetical protein
LLLVSFIDYISKPEFEFFQLLWVAVHFCLMGIFALTLVVLIGGLPYVMMYKQFIAPSNGTLLKEFMLCQRQGWIYILAGTFVVYSPLISSFFETGDPRYRVPTDGLIILMVFLGTNLYRCLVRYTKMIFEKNAAVASSTTGSCNVGIPQPMETRPTSRLALLLRAVHRGCDPLSWEFDAKAQEAQPLPLLEQAQQHQQHILEAGAGSISPVGQPAGLGDPAWRDGDFGSIVARGTKVTLGHCPPPYVCRI